ncbi:D-alanyl-D-alanine dipeptidase [Streptomyces sp. NHF165]|uniref:M15 family metallopeptidase n=1 Tax=Streptomyces sp. NHF165 TaxID=2175864 RepID=UPI00132EBE4A|nr:M15 family metallopeptidase [Streptomyces sp. NHF165]QHF94783.1 D-alanyl-D-alanine dipeptidase [Streptomyces sp. NHF165]
MRRPSSAARTPLTVAALAALALTAVPAQAATPAAHTPDAPSPVAHRPTHPSHGQQPTAPGEFVALSDVAPTIRQDIRYFTPHNFVGEPVDGYRSPMCLVTEDTARALARAQRAFLRQGYTLKVYDCYRPQRAVDHFVRWAADPEATKMKGEFYPRVAKDRLFEDGYIAEKSGHSRGSTVDLTLAKLPAAPTRPYVPGEPLTPCYAPKDERFPDNSVDAGTGFDCFDTLSHTDDPRVTPAQRANRQLLKKGLERQGFTNLPEEWWHFTHEPETFPDTYFDFPVSRRSLTHRH